MYKYLIPGYYLLYSRINRKSELLSLLIVYPVFLFVFISLNLMNLDWWYVFTFCISLISWFSFYENGYLENDAITIKQEENPTLRLMPNEIIFIQNNFIKIQFLKILIGSLGIILIFLINKLSDLNLNILGYIILIIAARISFYFHNTIRNRWNILTYFFLSTTKYTSLVVLFLGNTHSIYLIMSLLLVFPIPRMLEHACKVKYELSNLKKIIGDFDKFRLVWYGIGLVIIVLLYLSLESSIYYSLLFSFLWFFIFRLSVFLIVRLTNYNRSTFSSQEWN